MLPRPHAENLYALAEALELAGQGDESQKAFAEFERKSLVETNFADNSNHELIAYYVDHAHQPGKALEVAEREIARHKDVFTLDSNCRRPHAVRLARTLRKLQENARSWKLPTPEQAPDALTFSHPWNDPCDKKCDLGRCFWYFSYFRDFVVCITCVLSMGCEGTSPPLRTTFYLLFSSVYRRQIFV
jgi:hypothetical protein